MYQLTNAAKYVPDAKRLKFLDRILAGRFEQAQRRTDARRFWLHQLSTLQEDGQIRVIVWSRDCDHCEGYHTYVVPVASLDVRIESDFASAEGPMHHTLARPSQEPDLPRSRDRILEAFEDGHPWSV
jgi:hypothetical protein